MISVGFRLGKEIGRNRFRKVFRLRRVDLKAELRNVGFCEVFF